MGCIVVSEGASCCGTAVFWIRLHLEARTFSAVSVQSCRAVSNAVLQMCTWPPQSDCILSLLAFLCVGVHTCHDRSLPVSASDASVAGGQEVCLYPIAAPVDPFHVLCPPSCHEAVQPAMGAAVPKGCKEIGSS